MARKTVTREIGHNRYRATQLKVRKANRVLERLVKTFGETLGKLAENVGSGETDVNVALIGDLKRGALSDAAEALVKNLSGDELNWIVDQMRDSLEYQTPELRAATPEKFVKVSGDLWDDIFAGALLEQFTVLWWMLELNFGSFFEGAGGLVEVVRTAVTPTLSPSSSPTEPNSGSTASSTPSA